MGYPQPTNRALRSVYSAAVISVPIRHVIRFDAHLLPGSVQTQVEELLEFLTSTRSMVEMDLELKIHNHTDSVFEELVFVRPYASASLTSLKMHVSGLTLPSGAHSVLGPFINAFQMPFLEQLSLAVALNTLYVNDYMTTSKMVALPDIVHTLFPDPRLHELLTSLTINIFRSAIEGEPLRHETKPMLLNLHLDRIPHVSTLNLTTFTELSFARRKVPDPSGMEKRALREVQLRSCKEMDADTLRKTVRSLKEADAWEFLDRVVIQKCDALDYDTALEAVGKERLHYLDW